MSVRNCAKPRRSSDKEQTNQPTNNQAALQKKFVLSHQEIPNEFARELTPVEGHSSEAKRTSIITSKDNQSIIYRVPNANRTKRTKGRKLPLLCLVFMSKIVEGVFEASSHDWVALLVARVEEA